MTTRLSNTSARLFIAALSAPVLGARLRRLMARSVVGRVLVGVDFAAEGEPAPFHVPRARASRAPRRDGPATALAVAYRAGRVSPSDVTNRALAAAASVASMRTFLHVDETGARAEAARSTERYRRGESLGALDGVPFAIKDEIDVAGMPTTYGSSITRTAARDSAVVARLRRAGAVLLGKTNMHELGAGPTGVNPHHGNARNPFDPERDTGGSSSGSAAAVAEGIVPLAIGTDSGGSLRVPGSLCGVVAVKPTFGLVSTRDARLIAPSLEHFGPIAATVADVASAMELLTGDAFALTTPTSLLVGICDEWWSMASPEVGRIVREVVDALGELVAIDLPHLSLAPAVMAATFGVEGARSLEEPLASLGTSARLAFELGRALSADDYLRAQRARALVAVDFEAAFRRVDVIVTPTTAITAPPIPGDGLDEGLIERLVCFTVPANLAGIPAVQVPCGHDAAGLPVGLQVMAAQGRDALALAVAQCVEARSTQRRPRVWYDIVGGWS